MIEFQGEAIRAVVIIDLCTRTGAVPASRAVRLKGAEIVGSLNFEALALTCPLQMIRCNFEKAVVLRDAKTKFLDVSLCVVPGLNAQRVRVEGSLFLDQATVAAGPVVLTDAWIDANLIAVGCKVRTASAGNSAVVAIRLRVGGSVQLNGMQASGMLDFEDAQIGGTLILNGATIEAEECDYALQADNLNVKGNILGRETKFKGGLSLLHARIGGEIDIEFATVTKGKKRHALYGGEMQVGGGLFWRYLAASATGAIDLRDAVIGQLYDDAASWPQEAAFQLHGFCYTSFGDPQVSLDDRLAWLSKQTVFNPNPYEQASSVLRATGFEKEARAIAFAKHEELRKTRAPKISSWGASFDIRRKLRNFRIWNWSCGVLSWVGSQILRLTIGHGYYIGRSVLLSLLIIGVGTWVFQHAWESQVMSPVKQPSFPFNSFVYSVDVFLPFVNLRQEEYWMPSALGEGVNWYTRYMWAQVFLGWTLTTLAVSALSGLVRKN